MSLPGTVKPCRRFNFHGSYTIFLALFPHFLETDSLMHTIGFASEIISDAGQATRPTPSINAQFPFLNPLFR
jgi:hypothetical protein